MNKPTPSPGHELCSRTDPEASHFWCGHLPGDWIAVEGRRLPSHSHPCGEFWQKPVKVDSETGAWKRLFEQRSIELEKVVSELAQAKAALEQAMATGQVKVECSWPAPIPTSVRLPTEKDSVNGLVRYLEPVGLWPHCKWQDVSYATGFWLTPPPIPQADKGKDEAAEDDAAKLKKDISLLRFALMECLERIESDIESPNSITTEVSLARQALKLTK